MGLTMCNGTGTYKHNVLWLSWRGRWFSIPRSVKVVLIKGGLIKDVTREVEAFYH